MAAFQKPSSPSLKEFLQGVGLQFHHFCFPYASKSSSCKADRGAALHRCLQGASWAGCRPSRLSA